MWKLLLPFLFVCALNAQPYGHYKYAHPGAFMTTAFKTSLNTNGHLLCGYKANSTAGTYNFCLDKTDPSGAFTSGSNSFSKAYQLFNTTNCGAGNANQILNCSGISVIETSVPGTPRGWYALSGAFDEGSFFALLDSSGNVIHTKAYLFPYTNPYSSAKTYITESSLSPYNYFLCGTHDTMVYAMKVNPSGTMIWSAYHHIGTSYFMAQSIMECPFTGDIIIIGSTNTPPVYGTATDGFLLRLSSATGSVVSYKTYSLPGGACQQFSSIKPAYSGNGSQGYVLGGYTDSYPALPWMLKIGINGNVIWSTVIEPSGDPGAPAVTDVIERPVGSTYEYYGAVRSNAAGMTVVKLDDNGTPVATNNEFIFNAASTLIGASSNLDFENTGSHIALTAYGTADGINGGDLYMVRSYFNGKTGCNETNTLVSNYYAGPNTVITPWISSTGSLSACNMFQLAVATVTPGPTVICSSTVVAGGSNSGVTLTNEINENNFIYVYPNPARDKLFLSYSLKSSSTVRISIYNQQGGCCQTVKDGYLEKGDHHEEINLDDLNYTPGIYLLRLTDGDKSYTCKISFIK
jgi:hypothetical protein